MPDHKSTPTRKQNPGKDVRLAIYRMMYLIRRAEQRLMDEYHPADEMRCPMHFCIGQEATPGALSVLLRQTDTVMCPHRSHGFYLSKGAPLEAMIAEFYGKRTGSSGGLAGSQELSHGPSRFYSGAVLGGAFTIGAGAAFAAQYSGSDAISVAIIGDGGMEEGVVFETLNLAAVRKLPVLFLCENNLYSAHTEFAKRSVDEHLVHRVESFGVPSRLVDGYDPLTLYTELAEVVGQIRAGDGPAFVEIMTYRTCGHVGPENDEWLGYRSADELEAWRERDPVPRMRAAVAEGGVSAPALSALEAEVDGEVERALAAAKKASFPTFEEVLAANYEDSYSSLVSALIEGAVSDFDGRQAETKLKAY